MLNGAAPKKRSKKRGAKRIVRGAKKPAPRAVGKARKAKSKKAASKKAAPKSKGGGPVIRSVIFDRGSVQVKKMIEMVEKAAKKDGVSVNALLEKAGVRYITHWQITKGKTGVTNEMFARYCEAVPGLGVLLKPAKAKTG
jgi:hypothetical protein